MADYEYGNTSGYQPKKLTAKLLAKWRTGSSAANPAGALLLVKEIDRLAKQRDELRLELAQCKKELQVYKDREEHISGMGID